MASNHAAVKQGELVPFQTYAHQVLETLLTIGFD
jgi:hypothetical protein